MMPFSTLRRSTRRLQLNFFGYTSSKTRSMRAQASSETSHIVGISLFRFVFKWLAPSHYTLREGAVSRSDCV